MKTITLDYYQDPGHGWVKIHLDKLLWFGNPEMIKAVEEIREHVKTLNLWNT